MERTKSINETLQLVKAHLQAPGQNWEYTPFWRRRTSGLEQWTPSASLWWWRRRTTQAETLPFS